MVLKSRKEPFRGADSRLLGIVASQIILDSLRSIGDIVIDSRYKAKNARANMMSIPAETKIASRMTGINTPAKTVIVHVGLTIQR